MGYMGAAQRRKGAGGEREAAAALQLHGLNVTRQARNGVDAGADVAGAGLVVECKRRHAPNLHDRWMLQADVSRVAPVDVPLVMYRYDGGKWMLTLMADDLSKLYDLITRHRMQAMR